MPVIHKEGRIVIIVSFIIFFSFFWMVKTYLNHILWLQLLLETVAIVSFFLILNFFRNPHREINMDERIVYAPADGRIIAIEEVEEREYFKDNRLKVSIFMSPTDIHLNRNPIGGKVKYVKYHPGKYFVAWHHKSSNANERNSIVIENKNFTLLITQIAGAVARRIKCYLKVEDEVIQGDELGFIKFGSRVDVFFPVNTLLEVKMNEKVKGGQTILTKIG